MLRVHRPPDRGGLDEGDGGEKEAEEREREREAVLSRESPDEISRSYSSKFVELSYR